MRCEDCLLFVRHESDYDDVRGRSTGMCRVLQIRRNTDSLCEEARMEAMCALVHQWEARRGE